RRDRIRTRNGRGSTSIKGPAVPATFRPALASGVSATRPHADARTRVAVHAGRHLVRDIQSSGQPTWGQGIRGSELVHGYADAQDGNGYVDAERHVQPR